MFAPAAAPMCLQPVSCWYGVDSHSVLLCLHITGLEHSTGDQQPRAVWLHRYEVAAGAAVVLLPLSLLHSD
jgi:hypothetical protein